MLLQFICKLVGNFKLLTVLTIFSLLVLTHSQARAEQAPVPNIERMTWEEYEKAVHEIELKDKRNGTSYVVSGSLALIGGLVGQNLTVDPIEKSIYTLFQTLGIASIGYGAYTVEVGAQDRSFYSTLNEVEGITAEQKAQILYSHVRQKNDQLAKERRIRAITHGLIAVLNIYNGSQQSQESVKNTLFFIGGVNALATLSYTF